MRGLSTRNLTTILLALVVGAFSGLPAKLGVVGAVAAEVLLVVCGAALAVRAARPWLGDASSRAPLRFTVTLLAALSVGQIARTKKAFPFMPYTMYGRAAEGDASFYEYEALHRSGARERFRPSLVVATLGRARIVKGLAREFDEAVKGDALGADAGAPFARGAAVLRSLITLQNRKQPSDPVTHVDVVRVLLPPPYFPEGATRRTLTTVAAEPAP